MAYFILFFCIMPLVWGCSSNRIFIDKSYEHYQAANKSYRVNDVKYIPKKHDEIDCHHEERGIASWYTTKKYPKAITASGDIFNPNALTAAHRTLPFMSVVRITSLENNKTIDVIINDRGPFIKNRVIDLSEGAAKMLDFKHKGIVDVKIQYLNKETQNLRDKIRLNSKRKKTNKAKCRNK